MQVKIGVMQGDALAIDVDVLALKYAQAPYGVDAAVARAFSEQEVDPLRMQPKPGEFRLLHSGEAVAARKVIFIGVAPLYDFRYEGLRRFARKVLTTLAREAPETRSVAMTLHGPGYGLDEAEAFESEIAGLADAIQSDDIPATLETLIIAEQNPGRATRLQALLADLIPSGLFAGAGRPPGADSDQTERLRAAGYASEGKSHIFVAMPFREDMDDVYHYGIQGAVRAAGFLCERADLSAFTGDVMQWVQDRIRSSSLLVADLTEANPNVYLEVGYAWGCEVPTVLLV